MENRQVRNKVRHRHGVGSVVLCIGEGQNRCWVGGGRAGGPCLVTSWGERALGSFPFLAVLPASRQAHSELAKTLSQSSSPTTTLHSRHNDSLPVPFINALSSPVILLFLAVSIHSPTGHSTAHHQLTSTRASRCHASPARLPRHNSRAGPRRARPLS